MIDDARTRGPIDALSVLTAHFAALFGHEPDAETLAHYQKTLDLDRNALIPLLVESSRESARTDLPTQVNLLTHGYCGNPVGFVHMMKTAGTSFTAALNVAVGLEPAVRNVGVVEPLAERASIWPYLAGHSHQSAFPDGFRLVTVVREPRVRLLSYYAAHHFHSQSAGEPRVAFDTDEHLGDVLTMTPDEWLLSTAPTELMAAYFLDQSRLTDLALGGNVEPRDFYSAVSRLDAMAWSEEPSSMIQAIQKVTGRRVRIPRLNVTAQPWDETRPISADLLDAVTEPDRMFLEAAIDLGLLPRRSRNVEDAELAAQASRLGFTLE